jgi:hypothetical protein
MLSLSRCREILGANRSISDEQVKALRDQLYTVADLALDAFQEYDSNVSPDRPRSAQERLST